MDNQSPQTVAEQQASSQYLRPDNRTRLLISTVCLVAIAVCVVVAALVYLQSVLTPLLIAVFMYFIVTPIAEFLVRLKLPRWMTYTLLFGGMLVLIELFGWIISTNVQAFAQKFPRYETKLTAALDWLARVRGLANMEGLFDWERYTLMEFFNISQETMLELALGTTLSFVEISVMALFYLMFLFLEVRKLPNRIRKAYPTAVADEGLAMVHDIDASIRRYLIVKTGVSLGLGATTGLIGYFFGLDFWMLWGILMFIANYITYIGSIAAIIPPIAVAFLQFDSLLAAIALAVVLTLNRLVWIDYAEIRYSGRSLNVSPLLLLLSIALFGWLWGVLGMVLAVPVMTSAKIILSHFAETRHLAILMSDE